jgi:hypothetical protein
MRGMLSAWAPAVGECHSRAGRSRKTSAAELYRGSLVLLAALLPATAVGNGVTKPDAPPPPTPQIEIIGKRLPKITEFDQRGTVLHFHL